MEQQVILVDENDKPIGAAGKMEVHQKGLLHRAFSIFIFNSQGEMLLQQRALDKYHSGGLWSNACCSHPAPGEEILQAASRRLKEELGLETELKKLTELTYKANLDNGLTEHEYDHVFIGEYDGRLSVNKEEISDTCYQGMLSLQNSINSNPGNYTTWFRLIFPRVFEWWQARYGK